MLIIDAINASNDAAADSGNELLARDPTPRTEPRNNIFRNIDSGKRATGLCGIIARRSFARRGEFFQPLALEG